MIADLLLHLALAAEDAEVLEHRRAELLADLPRPLAAAVRAREQRVELGSRVGDRRLRHVGVVDEQRRVGCRVPGAPAEGDRLHQRVAAEAVGPVHGDARHLARRVQARRARSRPSASVATPPMW